MTRSAVSRSWEGTQLLDRGCLRRIDLNLLGLWIGQSLHGPPFLSTRRRRWLLVESRTFEGTPATGRFTGASAASRAMTVALASSSVEMATARIECAAMREDRTGLSK